MKKHFFPIQFTFAVLLAWLAVSCFSPSGNVRQKAETGTLTVRLAGNDGRTLMPDDPVFDSYNLEFLPQSGQTQVAEMEDIPADDFVAGKNITLEEGDWKITAKGYVVFLDGDVAGIPAGRYLVAQGDKTITVDANTAQTAEITVGTVPMGQGSGILEYDIDVPLYAEEAELEVLDLAGAALVPPVSITLSPGANQGSEVLLAGYYILKLRVEGNPAGNVTTKIEVVHIYPYLTTTVVADANLNLIKKGNALPLIYKVNEEGTAFTGTFESGQTYPTTLGSSATIVDSTEPDGTTPNGVKAVLTGNDNNGYIALGDMVGTILKTLDEWTLETYVFIPAGATLTTSGYSIWAFGVNDTYNGSNQVGATMWLGGADLGLSIRSAGWGGTSTGTVATGGDPDARGAWKQVVVTMGSDKISVYMDGKLVRQGPNTGETLQKTTVLNAFRYGYLGRSIFHANGDSALRDTQYYQFGVYEGAMSLTDIWTNAQRELTILNGEIPAYPEITDFTVTPVIGLEVNQPNTAPGAIVANFTGVAGGFPPFTYSLVSGTGDVDNTLFEIDGTTLKVKDTALTVGTKTVRVEVTDANSHTYAKAYTFRVEAVINQILGLNFNGGAMNVTAGGAAIQGTLSYTTGPGATGLRTGAGVFNGNAANYIQATKDGGNSLLAGLEAYSVSFWLQPSTAGAGGGYPSWWSFAHRNASAPTWQNENYIGVARVEASPNNLNMERFYNGRNEPASATFSAPNVMVTGTWVHVAIVNGEDYATMYVDGVEVGTKGGITQNVSAILGLTPIYYIGRSTWGSGEPASGSIADYRVYDGPLSVERITALYDEGALEKDETNLRSIITAVTTGLGGTTLNNVVANLTLPLTSGTDPSATSNPYLASIVWESDNPSEVSDTGVVTRPIGVDATVTLTATFTLGRATLTETFTVNVPLVVPVDEVARKIRRAEVSLGDLSTVDANITLPQSDALVTVVWVTGDDEVVTTTGVITRPTDSPVTTTLTGTFTSVHDPQVSETKIWNVRVMQTGATPKDYLNVHYAFVDVDNVKVLQNIAPSGNFYVPTLESGATVDSSILGYDVINLGASGYIDLGPKVGALLRKPEWTIEFYVYAQTNTGTLVSFSNDTDINNNANSPWRGVVTFSNPALWFRAYTYGRNSHSSGDASSSAFRSIGGSGGLGSFTGAVSGNNGAQWAHIMLIKSGQYIGIFRNWGMAINTGHAYDFNRISDSGTTFGSGNPELEDLRFAYLGKSPFDTSVFTSDDALQMANARFYGFKVYSKAWKTLTGATGVQLDDPYSTPTKDQNTLRGEKKDMNDAWGRPNTN